MAVKADELISRYEQAGIPRVKLGVADIDGVLRGKYISLEKFRSIASGTSAFCDCVLGWDVNDQLYDNAEFTGWHTAFPDALYRLDLGSERLLADEGGIPYFIGEFVQEKNAQEKNAQEKSAQETSTRGNNATENNATENNVQAKIETHNLCPRGLLKRVLEVAKDMGYEAKLAFEYEFFVFRENPQSVRDKNYTDLVPLSPGNFGYSVLRTLTHSDLFNELMDYCSGLDIELEAVHCETGPGVWEAAICVDDALAAADKAILFKTFTKAFFQKRDLMATFMAKWSMDYPGQSGHCHQSLFRLSDGNSAFFDESGPGKMSAEMRSYVAGLQTYMRELLAMTSPTINSYTRLVKGAWAPTAATWGVENRTCALRVIPGTGKSQRVEFRVGSADANPYLVAAANIAAGLIGIREKLDPGEPLLGNAYDQQDDLPRSRQLPSNLRDAAQEFRASAVARQMFGDAFVEHFAATRDWEVREYERHVNDWQLKRYFEII